MTLQFVRDLISGILDLEMCGESSTAEGALEILTEAAPDLVLVDTALAHMNGIDFVAAAQQRMWVPADTSFKAIHRSFPRPFGRCSGGASISVQTCACPVSAGGDRARAP